MVVTFKFLSEFTEIMYNRKLNICIFESILQIQVTLMYNTKDVAYLVNSSFNYYSFYKNNYVQNILKHPQIHYPIS